MLITNNFGIVYAFSATFIGVRSALNASKGRHGVDADDGALCSRIMMML